MKKRIHKFISVFQNPKAKLIISIILLISAIFDLIETSLEEFMNVEIKIHHGVIIFCIAKILESSAGIIDKAYK